MPEIRVVSAIADKKTLTLYKEDGTLIVIPQGDYRVQKLLDQIIPITARGEVAIVDVENFSVYAAFTQRTNGFVRFFKIAKEKVKHIFGLAPEEPVAPVAVDPEKLKASVEVTVAGNKPKPMSTAEILKQAEVIGVDDSHGQDETVIAVVKNGKVDTIIPHTEKLREQIIHATKTENTVGMENFLKRVSTMIAKRGHSVEDLLRFMERGDLPVADDGSIIAYKRLNSTAEEGIFVDCHSGRVKQAVGSFVIVDESMVDKNRRNECSNGLHIARRAYLGGFTGNVMVLCKIAPEDVITVPHNDPNKVRVCAYHILSVIPPEAAQKLINNRPMTDNPVASRLLAEAISGKHVGKLEEVRIRGQKGNDLLISKLNADGSKIQKAEVTTEETKVAKAFDDNDGAVGSIDPKKINQQVAEEDAKVAQEALTALNGVEKELALPPEPAKGGNLAAKPGSLSNKQQAQLYFDQMIDENHTLDFRRRAAQSLKDVKKRAKKPYGDFGLHDAAVLNMFEKLAQEPVEEPKAPETVINPPTEEGLKIIERALAEATPVPPKNLSSTKLTNKEIAAQLYGLKDWDGLVALKKRTKKSWSEWFSAAEEEEILSNLPKK